MKTLDIEFFRAAGACYDPETVLGMNWTGTILDILQMESIPAKDRIWAATRPGVLSEKTLRLLACRCVRETTIGGGQTVWDLLPENSPGRAAVEIAERFAKGEATNEELAAAFAAADAAAFAAATTAAAFAAFAAADAAAAAAATFAAAATAAVATFAAAATARRAQIGFFIEGAYNEKNT
jgi:hypothetical protein